MAVRKRAEIVVTAKTDQAAQEFQRLAASEEQASAKLAEFVAKARAANDAARFAGFDKGVESAKRLTPALATATMASTAATRGLIQFSQGAGTGGLAAGALKTGIMAASAAAGPLGMALAAAGIAAVDFASDQHSAAKATEETTIAMEKQRRVMALQREAAARSAREDAYRDRMNREYWADRQKEVDGRLEELKSIENSLAQHGRGKEMSAYIAREAEIRADNAAAMGRHEEAAEIRRAEELRKLTALGEKDRERATHKREQAKWSAEITNQLLMQKNLAGFTREGSDSREFKAELDASRDAVISKSFAEFRKQQMIDAASAEIRGQESMLEIKLQGIEREKAAGVDPWSLAQKEADAHLFALDARQHYIDQTLAGHERLIASEEVAAARRQVLHQRELQSIAATQRKRAEQRRAFEQIGNAVGRVHEGMAAAALRGAFSTGQSVKQSVRHFAAAEAQEMTITAATEGIRGLVALASYNYPKATQHFTNAGLAGAQAIALGSIYGVTAGNGHKPKTGSGLAPATGANFGLAPIGGDAGGGMSQRSGEIGKGPPISRQHASPPPSQGGPIRTGGSTTINFYSLTGPDSQQMIELRRALKRSERDDGDVN